MEYRRSPHDEENRRRRRKKQKIRRLILLVQAILVVALAVVMVVVITKVANIKDGTDASSSDVSVTSGDTGNTGDSSNSGNNGNSSDTTRGDPDLIAEAEKWYLLLVNPDNSVSKDFIDSVNLSEINSAYRYDGESCKYLDSRITKYFENMCKAAKDDGVKLWSVSAYRKYEKQVTLFNNKVNRLKSSGMDDATARIEAAKVVAIPGTSEHHLGLAVDINSVEESFEKTAAFRWLQENAADYGFIMRYPKDKQDITKIIYEPWHYRYVGVEHAKAMNELDMCLEEYIEYLKSGGTVR